MAAWLSKLATMPHATVGLDVYCSAGRDTAKASLGVGLPERMDAVARGIHSAVIREASALVLKSFAHPAR